MQNIVDIGTWARNKKALSTKDIVGRKWVDVSAEKVICTTSKHYTDNHLYKKTQNSLKHKENKAVSGWKG